MKVSRREIVELWQRAQESLRASNTLLATGFRISPPRVRTMPYSTPHLPCSCRRESRFEATVGW
jgi:hypothetical protein